MEYLYHKRYLHTPNLIKQAARSNSNLVKDIIIGQKVFSEAGKRDCWIGMADKVSVNPFLNRYIHNRRIYTIHISLHRCECYNEKPPACNTKSLQPMQLYK